MNRRRGLRDHGRVADRDWSQVEPTSFDALFERTLDPEKRPQIGAHKSSRADLGTLPQPVMMAPLNLIKYRLLTNR